MRYDCAVLAASDGSRSNVRTGASLFETTLLTEHMFVFVRTVLPLSTPRPFLTSPHRTRAAHCVRIAAFHCRNASIFPADWTCARFGA